MLSSFPRTRPMLIWSMPSSSSAALQALDALSNIAGNQSCDTALNYNQLAYSVTINLSTVENSITTDKRSEKNAALNKILDQVLSIVESNGDSVVSSFGIILDSSGTYQFTQSSDTQKLRFIADVYGKRTIDELTEKQQNQNAADIIHYLLHFSSVAFL